MLEGKILVVGLHIRAYHFRIPNKSCDMNFKGNPPRGFHTKISARLTCEKPLPKGSGIFVIG